MLPLRALKQDPSCLFQLPIGPGIPWLVDSGTSLSGILSPIDMTPMVLRAHTSGTARCFVLSYTFTAPAMHLANSPRSPDSFSREIFRDHTLITKLGNLYFLHSPFYFENTLSLQNLPNYCNEVPSTFHLGQVSANHLLYTCFYK